VSGASGVEDGRAGGVQLRRLTLLEAVGVMSRISALRWK
jgi:hypothetical protein